MRKTAVQKTYEKVWFRIPLNTITKIDAECFPDSNFYSRFYDQFFRTYSSWAALDNNWIQNKIKVAQFILSRPSLSGKILSIGCGIGFIEKYLIESAVNNLEIHETSESPLQWIQSIIPSRSVHVGRFPECIPSDQHFNYIFLSTIDYCFDRTEWIQFLKKVKSKLITHGRCLIITPSFFSSSNLWTEAVWNLKMTVKQILAILKIRELGQLWGWVRTTEELRNSMLEAGFIIHEEGYLKGDAVTQKLYWLECS